MGSRTFGSGGDEHGRRTHCFYPGRGFLLIRFCYVFILSRVQDAQKEQKPKRLSQGSLTFRFNDHLVTTVKGWFFLSRFGEFAYKEFVYNLELLNFVRE